MKPDEPTVAADEHERRDGWDKLALSTRYREYYRLGLTVPVAFSAGGALETSSDALERHHHPLEVVFSAVPFQRS